MERWSNVIVLILLSAVAAASCKPAAQKSADKQTSDQLPADTNPPILPDEDEDDDADEDDDDPCESTSSSEDDDDDDDDDDADEDDDDDSSNLRGLSLGAKSVSPAPAATAKAKATKHKSSKKHKKHKKHRAKKAIAAAPTPASAAAPGPAATPAAAKTATTGKRGLNLTDSVTYDDIESILDNKCLTCHDSGGTSPDLSTYSKVKSKASSIESSIDDGSMPPSGSSKLTTSEKNKIRQWIEDGKLETADDSTTSDEDEEEEDDDTSTSSDCADDDEDADDDDDGEFDKEEAFEELLNPKQLKECHDDDKVYDRGKEKCHISKIATSYDCDVAGVVAKFKSYGITLPKSGSDIEGFEGYTVDQCGEYQNDPVIFFYKKVDEADDEVRLSIKVLCKKNSPACAR